MGVCERLYSHQYCNHVSANQLSAILQQAGKYLAKTL